MRVAPSGGSCFRFGKLVCSAAEGSRLYSAAGLPRAALCSLAQRRRASGGGGTVDRREVHRFGELSSEWALESDAFKALHSFNRLRVPWIVQSLTESSTAPCHHRLRGLRIADVACGGGILTIPLARLGATVEGLDAAPEAVEAAATAVASALRHHVGPGSAKLLCATVEKFAENNAGAFDAVVASEVLEHVSNVEEFVTSCTRLVRSGGRLFFTTINRTVASRALAIWAAEEVFKVVPSGVHDWSKFVEPLALRSILEANGCRVLLTHGCTYNPLLNKWFWIDSTAMNYAVMAEKR